SVDTQAIFIWRHLGTGRAEHEAPDGVIDEAKVDGNLARATMRLVGILHLTTDTIGIAHQHANHRDLMDATIQMRTTLVRALPAPRRAAELTRARNQLFKATEAHGVYAADFALLQHAHGIAKIIAI